jgi:hypothetical protein
MARCGLGAAAGGEEEEHKDHKEHEGHEERQNKRGRIKTGEDLRAPAVFSSASLVLLSLCSL